MSCNLCRGKLVKTKKPIKVVYLGVSLELLNLERSRCVSCKEEFFNPRQASEYSRAAEEQYAIKTRLTGEDILRIRKKLKLSQAEMEKVLGLGKKVVVRWENDKVRLPGAVNALLKILDKRPDTLRFV
jgi:putative zinc finger/helix-turn-helix YgiT family protein